MPVLARDVSTAEVLRVSGLSARVILRWTKAKIITPSVHVSTGSGDGHIWSRHDLASIMVLKDLREAGFDDYGVLRRVFYLLRQQPFRIEPSLLILIRGNPSLASWLPDSSMPYTVVPLRQYGRFTC